MPQDLKIIKYPDPRLKKPSEPVTVFDQSLKELAAEMIRLMHEHRGVGLAAPQVGVNLRMFVMNPGGEEGQDRVYVNPRLSEAEGEEEGDEGCLSIPNLTAKIWRSKALKMTAQDLDGNPTEETAGGFAARVWQHETDHLNGTLILERMGPVARLAARRILKELQDEWEAANPGAVKAMKGKKRQV
jgi:peptide deformylase